MKQPGYITSVESSTSFMEAIVTISYNNRVWLPYTAQVLVRSLGSLPLRCLLTLPRTPRFTSLVSFGAAAHTAAPLCDVQ
jgi:hypothetical protein